MQLNLGRLCFVVSCVALFVVSGASQAQSVIDRSLDDGKVHPQYVLGASQQKWQGGQMTWYYNPTNQPANLSTDVVLSAIQAAASRWNGMCNITFTYGGLTSAAPMITGDSSVIDQKNVFGWGVLPAAQALDGSVTQRWSSGAAMVDTDVLINTARTWTAADLDGVLTQAFGSALGLGSSNVPTSISYANPSHDATYQRTLRGDDALGCAALYGAAPTAQSNRAFNWAETAYAQYLSPSPAQSGNYYQGYYYRFYPNVNSYVGTKDGSVFFMGPDGVIQNLGPLSGFFSLAQNAGF